jgi:hypothetical protein
VKTPAEIEAKIAEMSNIDATAPPDGMSAPVFIGVKVGALQALLWALGINDDNSYRISAKPGPPRKLGAPS